MNPTLIFSVIEAVVLAMSVGLLCWLAAKVVGLAELVSMHGNQIVDIGKRIEKLETAALLAATVPGKLDTILVRIENLVEAQKRIEQLLNPNQKQ